MSADLEQWYLAVEERGNPATRLDGAHPERAYSLGNLARPLVHGSTYFAELLRVIQATGPGDLVWFTDWQSNPDQQLDDDPSIRLVDVLGSAAERGVDVRALVWRSQSRALGFSHEDHRSLGELLQERGADVRLDMRVRRNGAHHQKFVVVRHAADATRDVAYLGGIDLCHGRRDDSSHRGDPQADEISAEYGARPPWHDVQVALQGPVVADVETVFRERWDDSTPTSRNPLRRWRDAVDGLGEEQSPLPAQAPPPEPAGDHAVQLLRTYPDLGAGWAYDFAPEGERSVARGYSKAVRQARRLIYIEDQFLWGREMSEVLVAALEQNPELRLIAVLPQFPDVDGWFQRDPQLLGRIRGVLRVLLTAPERVAFYGLENHAGTPVYVHAKVCVLDDLWTSIGSDNFCRRSWTSDSELSAAVIDLGADPSGAEPQADYGRRLRLTLAAEHLDRLDVDQLSGIAAMRDADLVEAMADCVDPVAMFDRFAACADALQAWHDGGKAGERPPGRLRRLPEPRLSLPRQLFAAPWYRYLHDPDGRPSRLRRRKEF